MEAKVEYQEHNDETNTTLYMTRKKKTYNWEWRKCLNA